MSANFETMLDNSTILSFRAERRARIDRGDRDLESEPDSRRIRHDLGKCDLTPLWGENAPRARLITRPLVSRPVFVSPKGRTAPRTEPRTPPTKSRKLPSNGPKAAIMLCMVCLVQLETVVLQPEKRPNSTYRRCAIVVVMHEPSFTKLSTDIKCIE